MSALIFITVLAAQAATQPAAPEPAVADASRKSHLGSSTFVDLEAGAGYSTNPNFEFGDNTGGGFGRLSVHGVHTRVSERTTTVLSAFAQDTFYTRRYGSQESLDLNAQHDARVSEKVRVFGDLDFAYDKGGQLDTRVLALPELPLPPGVIQPPILISPSDFLSVTGRHYIASGHLGTQLSLSSREFLSATTGVEHVVYKSGSFRTHYTTIPVSLGYDRQISTRTTVGARVSAQFTDYDGPTNVRVVTPELTVQTMLTERMSFVGSLGVSFSSVDDGIRTRHSTGLAGSGSLCSQGEMDHFCAHASLNQQATTVAGPARTVSAGVDYSRRLDADQSIQFSLTGSRYSAPTSLVSSQTFSHSTYVRGAAEYTRRFGGRLFGGANVAARRISQEGPDPKSDVSGSLFIRYRLGDVR